MADAKRIIEEGPDTSSLENLKATCLYIRGLEMIAQALQNDFVSESVAPNIDHLVYPGMKKSSTEMFLEESYENLEKIESKLE